MRLIQRRTVWCPTWLGLCCVIALLFTPIVWWCVFGESYLSLTRRVPAEVLVVEGWIGASGVRAAAIEYQIGGYQYLVTTGGLTSERGGQHRWDYSEVADDDLAGSKIPKDRIIRAPSMPVETQRTYESAAGVWRALRSRGMQPKALNVFTLGVHARRSRMIFAKASPPGVKVGVIAWMPPSYQSEQRWWWQSSERTEDLLKETAGTLFEGILNSGR